MTEERRLAAIVFSDICGYSRIMGEDEKQALAIVEMSASCIADAVSRYDGRVIKRMGDGTLCEFPSAVNAVRAAVEIQRAISEHNGVAPQVEQFQLRIGIHVGDVVVADGDIMGDGVNVASRIEPLAEPGGICISRDVFDLVQNKISIETVNLGPQDLKNISRRIDIYRVLIDAVEGQRPRAAARAPGKGGGWKRPLGIAGIVVLGALLVLAGSMLPRWHGRRTAQRAYTVTADRVRELVQEGKPAEALALLRSFPAKFRNTDWQAQIERMANDVEVRVFRDEISRRQIRFLKAIEEDDKDTALKLLEPEVLRRVDATAIWTKLRLTAGVLKIARIGKDNFRIQSVDLSQDRQSAVVRMQVFRKTPEHPEGSWMDTPLSEWRRSGDEWYLHPEPQKPPLPETGPRFGPGRGALLRGGSRSAGE